MKKFLTSLLLAATLLIPTASFSNEPPAVSPPAVEQTCETPETVIAAFGSIATETGDNLELVHQKEFDDGSSVLVFWKGGDTVLAVIFDTKGCFDAAEELTLAEFRDITGIVLAAT